MAGKIRTGNDQPDEQLDAWMIEFMRDMSIRRGVLTVLADFRSYVEAHERAAVLYQDRRGWASAAIRNIAAMGYFSSDRAITEYAEKVWDLEPVRVSNEG